MPNREQADASPAVRRKLFLHVGYPKTATTTLQKRIFARHPDICYLGKPLTGDLQKIEYRMLNLDSIQFARELPGLREMFLASMQPCSDHRNVLLSHEGFLRAARYTGHDIGRTADRIKQVFSDPVADRFEVHVLITIRKQVDIIPSYFFDSVSRSPRRFHQFLGASLENPRYGYFPSLFYDQVIHYYSSLFGRERIIIMPYEAFVTRCEDFLRMLSAHLNIDYATCLELATGGSHNVKLRTEAGYRLTANEYLLDLVSGFRPEAARLPKLLRMLLKRIPLKNYVFAMNPDERNRVQKLFTDTNRWISEEFDLHLEQYGYF